MPVPRPLTPTDPEVPEDQTLPFRIRAGNVAAYEAAFARYYAPLCRYVFALVESDDVAEDIVQDLLVRLWQHRREWDVRQSLRGYLYTAARGRAISYLRGQRVRRAHRDRTLACLDEITSNRPDLDFEAEELRLRLENALASLPPRTREAFRLNREEGLSYDAVAATMNISPKTVSVHVSRSLAVLRRAVTALSMLL